jgi:hypothetical protein
MRHYSLKFLFAVSTVLIVLVGYSQWRRQQMVMACESYNNEHVRIVLPNSWHDYVWQRKPTAIINMNSFWWMHQNVQVGVPDEELKALKSELREKGIDKIEGESR